MKMLSTKLYAMSTIYHLSIFESTPIHVLTYELSFSDLSLALFIRIFEGSQVIFVFFPTYLKLLVRKLL